MHARRIRPDTRTVDLRRLAAAGLSALIPGLGQLVNGRRRLAWFFLIPSLIVIAVGLLLWATQSPARLAAMVASPSVLGTLLTLNLAILVWRLLAAGQAFLDTRRDGPTGRLGIVGIAILALVIVVPHLMVYRYGTAFGDTFARVFSPATLVDREGVDGAADRLDLDDRINVLLVGVDTRPNKLHAETLTDTMLVASLDPVGKTVSLVSIPRDLVNVPLGDGNEFGPKLNGLYGYADRHPEDFPDGGMRTLQDAIGALLGIDIGYYARVDFVGFVDMIDAVGGVDITVKQGFEDPDYDGYAWGDRGFTITKGRHHLDGAHALAYARVRKPAGESDFTRAARQQQILVALRGAVTDDGSLLWELPGLLDAVGDTVSTDLPVERLPELAAILDEVDDESIVRAVIRHPLVKTRDTRYGSSLVPNLKAIRRVSTKLFPEPGGTPISWPTPKPTATPEPTPED